MIEKRQLGRKVRGIAAVLLPYESDGRIAVEAFQRQLHDAHRAGLMSAVNMDTGYVNYLRDAEQHQVLRWTREALGNNVPFVAGAYIEGRDGEVVALYRRQMDLIVKFGGIPILFQTARLHGKPDHDKVAAYRAACRGYDAVLGFELGRMFAPNGEIFSFHPAGANVAMVDGRELGSGSGRSKKHAEQEAARIAVERLAGE